MISFNIFFQSNREEKICEDLQSKSGLAPVGTELIVWKKAYSYSRKKSYEVLVKLRIPAHAERIMGVDKIKGKRGKFNLELNYWKKCRASEAEVLGIYSLGGRKIKTKVAESSFLSTFKYSSLDFKLTQSYPHFCDNSIARFCIISLDFILSPFL